MPQAPGPTALIVGASRGLGLALAGEYAGRGWHVIGTVRGAARTGLHDLADKAGGQIGIEKVDIVEPDQVAALRKRLEGRTLDLLIVNAGISNGREATIGEIPTETFIEVMVTNAL